MATSTLGNGTLVLAGTTSGTTTVTATAVAGTTTLTLPAATDTLVGKTTTDTLTNKTLTTPSVSSPTISDGTANGVAFLNGSKVLTTGSALVFDGTNFSTTGTIKGATTFGVGNATPSTSGAGITFPATESASSNANTLDDYEEGTWAPSQGSQLTVVGTFSSAGKYTKIGRIVHLSGTLTGSTSVAATASALIAQNLPFNATTSPEQSGTSNNAAATAGTIIQAYSTNIYTCEAISATTSIQFNVTYQV